MTPQEALAWIKVAAEVVGPTLAVLGTGWRFASHFAQRMLEQRDRTIRQDVELAAQSRQLEWQSRMLELVGRRQGTVPPPRPKLTTLEEPFELPPGNGQNE